LFIIANYLSKFDVIGKDRGKHGIYHEMIQTWVTYELVKVLYLYGLNPQQSASLNNVTPEIDDYIKYMTMQGSELFSTTQGVHKTLLKYTLHSGYFHKCNFAGVSENTWKDDVKFMIPFLVLTWLRQLQQFFIKEQKRTWSNLGNYTPHLRLSHGEGSDPLAVVYLSKADTGQPVKVKNFNDIKPNESYSKKKEKKIVFTSLEEWAMLILKPPVWNQLD
jgi:hypothetical protein